MSSPLVLVRAAALLWALFVVPAALTGLFCVVSFRGMGLFLAGLAMGIGPLLWCIGDERESDGQKWLGRLFTLLGLVVFFVLAATAAGARPRAEGRVHTRYSNGSWHYDRFCIGNLVPEIDQIHLGYLGARLLDPLFSGQQLRDLAAMTDVIYEEMAKDEDFGEVGSALPWMWREVSFSEFRTGHYFHVVPRGVEPNKPIPALVFLHGSGGNFLAYSWLLSKVSERTGCVVIAPTFGMGNWEKQGAYEAITSAITDAGKFQAIDSERLHLMGLSNGGMGVCLAESGAGPKFQSLIFLSAVWNDKVPPELLAQRLGNLPVLVLSGGSDDRVPWDFVSNYAEEMREAGMKVTVRSFPDDDHFLFFRRRKEVEDEVVKWLNQWRK